jgi:hypothetical protein
MILLKPLRIIPIQKSSYKTNTNKHYTNIKKAEHVLHIQRKHGDISNIWQFHKQTDDEDVHT